METATLLDLPPSTDPLTGSEIFETLVGGNSATVTADQIAQRAASPAALDAQTRVDTLAGQLASPGESTGAADLGFVQAGTGAVGRTLQSKVRERQLSVTDFMSDAMRADAASGSPVLDHAPAFNALITAMVTVPGRARNPGLSYRLDTNVIGTPAVVLEFDDDATFVGTGILFGMQTIYNKPADTRRNISGAPNAGTIQAVDAYTRLTNTSISPGYGNRQDYIHTGQLASGFSLGKGNVCVWQDIINGASGQSEWVVATTPTLASGGSWGIVTHEHNIMNRGPDNGYAKIRAANARWAGGIQMVPEADDLAGGTGNICRNALFAFCSAHSINLNDLGLQCKFYNGLLIEKDSIGPNGRGVLASGDTSGVGAQLPMYGLEIDQRWAQGINTTAATFNGNVAINLGNDHVLTWGGTGPTVVGSQATGLLRVSSSGSGAIQLNPGGTAAMQFAPVALSVNLFSVNGNIAGQPPAIVAAGADATISPVISSKGPASQVQINVGDLAVNTVGKGLRIKEGANAKMGVVTLTGTTTVVANTSVTATSRIQLTGNQDGGTPGFIRVSTRTAGTSFTITSSSATDASVVAYEIIEPA